MTPLPRPLRHAKNPLLTPRDIPPTDSRLEVCCVMNAGAIRRDGVTYLLLRVDERPHPEEGMLSTAIVRDGQLQILRFPKDAPGTDASDSRGFRLPDGRMFITVLSHVRVARSTDGETFQVDPKPLLFPSEPYEAYAVQDCRVVEIEGTFWINYSAVSDQGVATALASTDDFVRCRRHGIIFAPDNRNVCIFPEKIAGKYLALHRPMHGIPLAKNSIWMATSEDLIHWGAHRRLMTPRSGSWDSFRVGGGAPPIATPDGWLVVYHGADAKDRYCLGVALLDKDNPSRILARHPQPLLEPEADYELRGFFGSVVFTDGVVMQGDKLRVYYGASDEVTCLADFPATEVLNALKESTAG